MLKPPLVVWMISVSLTVLGAGVVAGQDYPNRPIRLILLSAPGGGSDLLARTVGQKLSESLHQPVVVDNRTGGGGLIGMEVVQRAAPDGYTILLAGTSNLGIAPSLYEKLPYDPVKDYAPITQLTSAPSILAVHPSVPAKSLKELIAYVRANPNKINFASANVGSVGCLHQVRDQEVGQGGQGLRRETGINNPGPMIRPAVCRG